MSYVQLHYQLVYVVGCDFYARKRADPFFDECAVPADLIETTRGWLEAHRGDVVEASHDVWREMSISMLADYVEFLLAYRPRSLRLAAATCLTLKGWVGFHALWELLASNLGVREVNHFSLMFQSSFSHRPRLPVPVVNM